MIAHAGYNTPSMRALLVALVGLSLIFSACQQPAPEPETPAKPNLLVIVADDLGYGDLGSYGQQRIKTPHLDALAAGGLRFTDHYAGSTVCAPSRSALMTGQHTGHTPIRGNKEVKPYGQHPIGDDVVTIAEVLKGAGYRTGLIGKWGLGGPGSEGEPNRQGFDYFYGYLGQRHAHNYYPEFLFKNTERVALDNKLPEPAREDGAGYADVRNEYSHDLIAQEALDFVEREKDGPFFLALTMTIPHANNEGKALGMEVPDLGEYAGTDWPDPQKGHAAMISRMDDDLGRLFGKLDELGIRENTLILFTSDNGPHREGGNDPDFNDSNGPLRGIKRDLYEGGIRVPLIASWPGRVPAGATTDHICAFWDYAPTLAEIAGAGAPAGIDGKSFAAVLEGGEAAETHEFLYWEFHEGKASKQAARMGQWKGVRLTPSAPLELYDLSADVGEESDVAAEHPEIVEKITAYLDGARTESEFWPLVDPGA